MEPCEIIVYGREVETGFYIVRCKTHERNFFSVDFDISVCPYGKDPSRTVLVFEGEDYEFKAPSE